MISMNTQIQLSYLEGKANYINAIIPENIISVYTRFLKQYLSLEDYELYTQNQKMRDNGTHHMTIVDPTEFCKLSKCYSEFIGYPLTVNLIGIGSIKEKDNQVFFVVCSCQEAEIVRTCFGLDAAYLHVTLGFRQHDIFDQPKDKSTLLFPFSKIETTNEVKI